MTTSTDLAPVRALTTRDKRPRYVVAHPGAELFGSDRMALESVRGMLADGADVVVALPEDGPLAEDLVRAGARVEIVPMLVLRKSLLRPRNWLTFLLLSIRGCLAVLRTLRNERPDAVYVSTVTLPQWTVLSAMWRLPVVVHVHEAERSGARLVKCVMYAPLLLATSVLVNSEFSRETIREALPAAARRAHLVYNGVIGPADASPPRETIDELRVLYVGRLSPRKGVDVVLDGAALLKEQGQSVRVSLLGSVFHGYEWYEDELRARAELPDAAETDFLGFQPDIWPVLAEHDVLVVPSRIDEPFGNTAVEGILARRPVIASDMSGLREAAGGYPTSTLINPDDPKALADALASVVVSWPALRRRVGLAYEQAEAKHAPAGYQAQVAAEMRQSAGIAETSREGLAQAA